MMNSAYYMLFFGLFFVFRLVSGAFENLKTLDNIIISDNETKIYSLDEYFTNSNLNFSIINPYSSIFRITLSESFNNLHTIEIKETSQLMKVKNLESIHCFVLLFENSLFVIHWEQSNSIISTNSAKISIFCPNPLSNAKCYDMEEIFLNDYHDGLTYLVLDCDLVSASGQAFFYYSILASDKTPTPRIIYANSQVLDPSWNLNDTRRLLYDNTSSLLYRYSPYSLKASPGNQSQLQVFNKPAALKFTLSGLIPNTSMYLESIALINGTILIMDYQQNLQIFNSSNQNYSDTFQNDPNEVNIQISYYQMRLYVLTNASLYRLAYSDKLAFLQVFRLNITSPNDPPQFVTQTLDYLYILSDKCVKIMKIDDSNPKKMQDSTFLYDLPYYVNHSKLILKFPDLVLKNALSIWVLQTANPGTSPFVAGSYVWSLNITQIQRKLLSVSCCNDSSFDNRVSMQNFTFNLTVNDVNMTVHMYYWNIWDYHLYFDPSMSSEYTNNLTYSFDSENILIPYTNWVVGPLKEVDIQNVSPNCPNFKVDCFKIFNVSFSYLQANDNIDVEFDSLVTQSVALNFTLNSTQMTIYWQTSKDLTFYIIDCFLDMNYLIEDCIMSFRKNHNVFRLRSAFAYSHFHIINAENLYYVHSSNPDDNENEIFLFMDPLKSDFAVVCSSILVYQPDDLIFCLRDSDLLIYKLIYDPSNDSLSLFNGKTYNYTDQYFQTLDKVIYGDFIESYNLLLLRSGVSLVLYVILFPADETSSLDFSISQKSLLSLPGDCDVFLLNQEMPIIIVIDYEDDIIEEYTIRIPTDFTFLRKFPTFGYDFQSSFPCNSRFLCLNVQDSNGDSFLVIYNVTEPTSKLLRYKIALNNTNDRIFPIIIYENPNAATFFHSLFTSSSAFVVISPEYGMSMRVYKVCDIVADIPEIFQDSQIMNKEYYSYALTVSFGNEMMNEMIFFRVIVNISLLNSVITADNDNGNINQTLNFINPPIKGMTYVLNITDSPFIGPVQNYKILNSYFIENNDVYYYDFYAFLNKSLDFEADYDTERKFYGNYKEAIYKDGILIVLSEKNLTFHDVNNAYNVVYFDNVDITCTDLFVHSTKNLLYLFCQSNSVLHLRVYEYNTTALFLNLSSSLQIVAKTELTPFRGSFESYIAAVMGDYHFFFLIDEGYYPDLYKKKKTVYIYNLPQLNNSYTLGYPVVISDKDFVNQYFLMSDAVDLQSYYIGQVGNVSYYSILVLMTKSLEVINCNFTIGTNSSDLLVRETFIINFGQFVQNSFNNNYVFYTVSLLNMTFRPNLTNGTTDSVSFGNFSLTYILSSNLHIYEFNSSVLQPGGNISTTAVHIYTKYYSCIFVDSVRPKKFKSFLGSFCTKTDIIEGIVENGFNYFVLHKLDAENSLFLAPVLAFPIYLKNYNFQFFAKKSDYLSPVANYMDDTLILPSFSSLFTEFELMSSLFLFLRRNANGNGLSTVLTAFNEISNASITLNIILASESSNFNDKYITLIIILSCGLFFILAALGAAFIINRRKRQRNYTAEEIQYIDDDYMLMKHENPSLMNELAYNEFPNRITKESTANGSKLNVRANSFLRVKQKNAKWVDS